MRKEQRKRENAFRFMIVVNILLAVMVVVFFWNYVRNDRKSKIEQALHVAQDKTSTLAQNFGSYLFSLDMVGRSYIAYIENTGLSRGETIEYLQNWRNFYAEIALVEVETFQAECLYADSARNKVADFGDKKWVTELCGKYDALAREESVISVTEPFSDDETGQTMIAFYRPLHIRGERYLLMFLSNLADLQMGGMNVQGLDLNRGLLIDGNGSILMGEPEGITERDENNYYSFAEHHSGASYREEFYRLHREQEAGHYIVPGASGEEWMCIFARVPMTDGWRYLYHVNVNEMLREADTVTLAFGMTLFMGAWLLLDIIVYFHFNRRLRKSLVIIEQKNEELAAASRAKTAFVSNVSHEIRTPINAVLGMDEMILRECRDSTIRAYASDIQKAGKVLLGLINDVLDFSKIESGKVEIVPAEYDVASVIHEVCNLIELRAKAKDLTLEIQVAPDVPVRLVGDEIRLKQIVTNLLNNAVKYTEKGSVTLSVAWEKASEEDALIAVSVKDTGIGIKPEDLNRLFDEFKRVDELRNRAVEGTGLGLPIVRKLLEKMGSRLEVESVYGLGSVFSFRLRQQVADWTPMGDFREARRRLTEQAKEDGTAEFRAPRAKLLAVDDNQVNLTVVKGLLKRTEMQVDAARSGEECLRLAAGNKYDLILLDHRMPGMDGIETLHRIRGAEGPNQGVPVIALTANVVSGAREMYISEGFSDFLSKPINANSLEKTIRRYLPEDCLERIPGAGEESDGAEVNGKGTDAAETAALSEDEALRQELLRDFVNEYPGTAGAIRAYLEAGDVKNYTVMVHGLKSSAGYVGAALLSEEARRLEEYGKAGDRKSIEEKTEKFLEHYRDVVRNVKKTL